MKRLVQKLAGVSGYRIVRDSDDPVLAGLLKAYKSLRRHPDDCLRWDHALARLASLSHLRTLLRTLQVDLLIDVGANRGQFAQNARRVGYAGDILSFEPQSALFAKLSKLARRDGRWEVAPCGLGAAASEATLNVYQDNTFSSLLEVNESGRQAFGEMVAVTHTERVSIRTLDAVLAERGLAQRKRVFLKSDTQGYEAAVLQGAERTLTTTVALMVEAAVAPIYGGAMELDELNGIVLPLGFKRAGMFPIGYAPRAHTLIEMDCFYTREPGAQPR